MPSLSEIKEIKQTTCANIENLDIMQLRESNNPPNLHEQISFKSLGNQIWHLCIHRHAGPPLILNVKSATNQYLTTIPKMCWFSIFPRTSNEKLFSINEEVQREALKGFYDRQLPKQAGQITGSVSNASNMLMGRSQKIVFQEYFLIQWTPPSPRPPRYIQE